MRLPSASLKQIAFALVVVSAAYYGLYLTSGFNYTDDGNYAQTAFELLLGRSPNALALSYGLLWFQAGEALFALFGVHFILVRLLFFTVITLTTLLVFRTVAVMSGSRPLALGLAAVTLFVPAFPATAFYGFCVVLNAGAQLRLVRRLPACGLGDGAWIGAALGLSFQIRSDFGFIFAAPFALLLLILWRANRPALGPVIAGAVAGFAAVTLPAVLLAMAGGYGAVLARQYFEYPALLWDLLANGLAGLGQNQHPALALLARPGWDQPAAMGLVYLPLMAFAAYAVFVLLMAPRWFRHGAWTEIGAAVVALAAGAATFPHYFFFRPDLSHIANFMPGFALMSGIFIAQLRAAFPAPRAPWLQPLAALAAGVCILDLGLYVWTGLPSPATGSIGVAINRTERFQAENGVDVRVASDEKAQLETLRDVIEKNVAPGQAIVCLPYCPGIAFMTARRMLLPNFYVDDTFLTLRPHWLPDAIAATRAAPPAVAVIGDWAINGTPQSVFANWAPDYVGLLKDMAHEQLVAPGVTIYVMGKSP